MFPLCTFDTCYNPIFYGEIFLFSFGVTRMTLNIEMDILVKYSKRNLCFHYGRVLHVITLFFMANTMEIFLSWFCVTRMALNAEKDILEEYSKRNLCSHYRRVLYVVTLFFYDKYEGNFILIWHNQDGLECREGRPGGVQQDKLVVTQ